MTSLLCLLSEQHVPNLLSIHHFKPDRLVLVETAQMKTKDAANRLLHALRLGGLEYQEKHVLAPLNSEDDLGAIRRCLQLAYGSHPADRWIANLTGGTKPMSIAAYEFFKALGGKLIYTLVSRPSQFIDIETGQIEEVSHRLSIKEFLAGYGFESRKSDKTMARAAERALRWAPDARQLALHDYSAPFSNEEREEGRKRGLELPADRLSLPTQALLETWVSGAENVRLDKYQVDFLTGGWLEVFFWDLLTRHADALGVWDVQLGLEVGNTRAGNNNECDVAFMHGHGLSLIECKSGTQSHDPGGDILYKMEAIVRQFRALRVRSYLATTAANLFDQEGKLKPNVKSRAEVYGCTIIDRDKIKRLAEHADDAATVRQLLFESPLLQ